MLGDDIDLNEIFADYFINEFEDPMNAYTNSMANYNGAAAAVALAQKQQQVDMKMEMSSHSTTTQQQGGGGVPTQQPMFSTLPTGGIKTSFHTVSAAPPPQQQQYQQQQYQQQYQQQHQQQHQQPGNIVVPAAKKLKADGQLFSGGGLVTAYHQTVIPKPQAGAPIIGRGAISNRLGFSVMGGQLALPNHHQQQIEMVPAPGDNTGPPGLSPQLPAGGIPLPVGVGIRLGGIGGVAPAMAQAGVRGGQYTMWSGGATMAPGAGVMSEQAVAQRRQRNREHAKRSRVRKKFMLESMQDQVRALQKENIELRMVIQEKIPEHAHKIISECCSTNALFSDPVDLDGDDTGKAKPTSLEKADFNLMESLTTGQQNFVLSDPRLPDNPIVYASPGFYVLTGYTQDQVLGRNCRFLQGPATDPRAVDIIRKAIASGSDATCCVLNYKADGTPFWNQFFVAALRDADNCIVNYVSWYFSCESHVACVTMELSLTFIHRWGSNARSNLRLQPRVLKTRSIQCFRCRTRMGMKMTTTTTVLDLKLNPGNDRLESDHVRSLNV